MVKDTMQTLTQQPFEDYRASLLTRVKRLVVKVGSGVLTGPQGLNLSVINDLSTCIFEIKQKGIQVILVSSGAIASGLKKLRFTCKPKTVSEKQALAAVGQASLIMAYERAFGRFGQKVAQVLLTRDDLTNRRRYLNARNTLITLLSLDIVPIINENDTVVVDEIKFGDNDNLSALVTNMMDADLLVNLTDIDGLFDKDPRTNPDAELVGVVGKVDQRIRNFASVIPGFLGTGGMNSKIKAAQKLSLAGIPTIIANGLRKGILKEIFDGKEVGTLFLPRANGLCKRKHWIAFTKSPKGEIIVDQGAERAIVSNGKSLLPSGIIEVRGKFGVGDSVVITSEYGKNIAIGLVNYQASDIQRIKGMRTNQIEATLGFKYHDEVIHRDNLVLVRETEEGIEECHFSN